MAKILIDFTDTYVTGLNTGIQRVVRNIIKNKDIIKDITQKEVIPTIFVRLVNSFVSYDRIFC